MANFKMAAIKTMNCPEMHHPTWFALLLTTNAVFQVFSSKRM